MKSFQKLVYFFSSKYYNNLKFSNRMLSTTRIFFERTTKNSHSLQALGNVYRNSKWSDLHVFNIKESFLGQFKSVFYLTIVIFFLLMFSSRFNLQWTNLLIFNLNELFFYFKDLVSSWLLFTFYTTSFIFLKLTLIFTKSAQTKVLPVSDTVLIQKEDHRNLTTTFNVNAAGTNDTGVLLPSLYLQKLVKYLHLVATNDVKITSREDSSSNFISFYSMLKNDVSSVNYFIFFSNKNKFNNDRDLGLFQSKDKSFYECIDSNKIFNVKFYKLNNNILKSLPFMFQKEFKNVITQNLNLGKENRWLMKNSLLSYDIITKASATTHVKKLYGSNQSNSNISGANIWASNKLSGYDNFTGLDSDRLKSSGAFINNTLLNNPSLLHLNNLEESFFWLVKRFKFLQTTSTYYQFEQRNFPVNSFVDKSSEATNYFNRLNVLKSTALFNTVDLTIYNSHNNLRHTNKENSEFTLYEVGLDSSPNSYLTNADLNFSKYFFNNITLQKNRILIYSNIE
jgi:hypothetical protein